MFFGVPAKRLSQFVLTHLRKHDVFHDDRVATNSGSNSGGLNLVLGKDACNNIRNVIELHDLTVNYCVWLQVLESQVE